MMPTESEIVEIIAIELDNLESDSLGWQNRTDMWKNICRNKAEIVLQTLLESLPVPKGKCPHGCYFAKDTHSGNYMMLLEMKK